jgi:uncharacterized protein
LLSYQVNAQVGGKLAQLGARLIDASAKQMADAFFDRFSQQVQAMSPAASADQHFESPGAATMAQPVTAAVSGANAPPSIPIWALISREPFGLPVAAWIGGAIFVVMILLMLGSMI